MGGYAEVANPTIEEQRSGWRVGRRLKRSLRGVVLRRARMQPKPPSSGLEKKLIPCMQLVALVRYSSGDDCDTGWEGGDRFHTRTVGSLIAFVFSQIRRQLIG